MSKQQRYHAWYFLIAVYGLSVLIATPYYNWKWARTHGFASWLFFGELVATAQALVWPAYAFSGPLQIDRTSQDRQPIHALPFDQVIPPFPRTSTVSLGNSVVVQSTPPARPYQPISPELDLWYRQLIGVREDLNTADPKKVSEYNKDVKAYHDALREELERGRSK